MLCADLDRLDELARSSWMFAHNGAGLLAIYDRDHGFRDARPLRAYVETALAAQNLHAFGARITFITMPRFLGYAFNPISFYYCYDSAGRLGAVLHQVKNTFGDQIGYLLPVRDVDSIRQTVRKHMHVSPFFDLRGGYRFALTAPGERLTVSILYGTAQEKRMTATMLLTARPWAQKTLLGLLVEMPFNAIKVIAAIHVEALKLFLKGAVFSKAPTEGHKTIIAGEGS